VLKVDDYLMQWNGLKKWKKILVCKLFMQVVLQAGVSLLVGPS